MRISFAYSTQGYMKKQGSCFSFLIGNKAYQFTNDLWKTLLDITMGDSDEENEVDLLVINLHTHVNFDWSVHVNELLKVSRVEDCYDPITIGQLKMVPRILLWVVSHTLQPKNGDFSRIDNADIHLVYILLHKVKINWPHYFVSHMFSIKKWNNGTSFFYPYMIAKILNYFDIALPNLTYKSPSSSQEFSHHTLINMNYFWDANRRVCYLRLSKHGRKVYNFTILLSVVMMQLKLTWMVSNLWEFSMMLLKEIP